MKSYDNTVNNMIRFLKSKDVSVEMMRRAMENSDSALLNESPLWPDDEAEIAKLCGIR